MRAMMIGIGGRQTDRQTDRDRDREGVRATKYATGTVNVVRSCKSNRRTVLGMVPEYRIVRDDYRDHCHITLSLVYITMQ